MLWQTSFFNIGKRLFNNRKEQVAPLSDANAQKNIKWYGNLL